MIPQELLLVKIIKLLVRIIPKIDLPKRVGRPFVYQPIVIICCLLVMVAKRLTVRALHAFLTNTDDSYGIAVRQTIPFPEDKVPNRRTFDRRFKASILFLQYCMLAVTTFMVTRFKLGIARLSLDNRMFEAVGAIWHSKDKRKGNVPKKLRNVDSSAGWGFSHYRGWIYGHALDVFVTTGKTIVPILAFARSLTIRGNTAAKMFAHLLPRVLKGVVSADSEYDDTNLNYVLTSNGRHLHTPKRIYPDHVPKSTTYQRRKTTVEPFFERFLQAFVARGKLDRKGPDAWPYLVTCCLLYQLMVVYNLLHGKVNPMEVTHLIRIL